MADNGKLEDHKQKSRERDQLLLAYLRGELGAEETARLRQRLADDPEYAERLEELLLGGGLMQTEPEDKAADFLPEEKQRSIIRWGKWKSRLSNAAYTVGISLLIGFVLLFVNYWIGRSLYEDMFRVSKDLVNFTQPGIVAGSSGAQVGLFYGSIQMELREKVGATVSSQGISRLRMCLPKYPPARYGTTAFGRKICFSCSRFRRSCRRIPLSDASPRGRRLKCCRRGRYRNWRFPLTGL